MDLTPVENPRLVAKSNDALSLLDIKGDLYNEVQSYYRVYLFNGLFV